jgi:hypothetical protein
MNGALGQADRRSARRRQLREMLALRRTSRTGATSPASLPALEAGHPEAVDGWRLPNRIASESTELPVTDAGPGAARRAW